jgi:hypothetical protein
MKNLRFLLRSFVWILSLALVTGCNLPRSAAGTPTLDVTQAYQTVEARLTQAANQTPSSTPTPTDAGAATPTATSVASSPVSTATTQPSATVQTQSCNQASAGSPIDVTIPDDTKMQPGQSFTKTWRLQNTGTCTWSKAYSVALFSGEAMSAPASVPLPKDVPPGQSVDVSVDMIAPQPSGTYQGNWKLRDASNNWFGIGPNGGSPFWVRIVVGEATPGTPTVTTTGTVTSVTPTLTQTSGPAAQASGNARLLPNDTLNLDTNQLNPGGGADLSYNLDNEGKAFLAPIGNALLGPYGPNRPTIDDCQGALLSSSPLMFDSLYQGVFLCYRTDQGLYGWSQLTGLNPNTGALTMQILTWAQP